MIEDFRFATRVLLKSPAYSLVALVTLALGVGATVAIFSAVYAVLLAPLPYPDPDALVVPVSTNAARGLPSDWISRRRSHRPRRLSTTPRVDPPEDRDFRRVRVPPESG
jgi:hypothetical protein